MTPSQLEELFHQLIDDENLPQATFFNFANVSFNSLWIARPWEFAKKSDDTKTTSVGVTTVALPTNFLQPLPIWIGDTEILPIRREDRRLYRDSAFRYYVDTVNSQIKLTYTPTAAETVYFDYVYEVDDVFTVANENTEISTLVPGFRKAFHPIMAYEAAKLFYMQEVGGKSDSWTQEMEMERQKLYALMEYQDSVLKASYQTSAIPDFITNNSNRSNVIDFNA